jgi:hypothetical protein
MKRLLLCGFLLALLIVLTAPAETARNLLLQYRRTAPYELSGIPEAQRTAASVFFVDAAATNASDVADGRHGESWQYPFATIDFAIGQCTASAGDKILVAATHTESLTAEKAILIDIAGVRILGMGSGRLRPTLSIATDNNEDAPIQFAAAGDGAVLRGFRILGAKTTTGSQCALEIDGGADYVWVDDCEFLETANTLELGMASGHGVIDINDVTTAVAYPTISNCTFTLAAGGDDQAVVMLTDGGNGCTLLRFENNFVYSDCATAVLDLDAGTNPLTGLVVANCTMYNADATAGLVVSMDSGDVALLIDNRIATGKGDSYPVTDISASYILDNVGAEPGTYGTNGVSATGADFSS